MKSKLHSLLKNHIGFSSLIKNKYLLICSVTFLMTFSLQAQVRPNINSLNVDPGLTITQEQEELACAVKDFLEANHDFVDKHRTQNIHDQGPNFYAWHRHFVGILEEHLISIGMGKYVPFPKWDPLTSVPPAFCGTGPCRYANFPAGHGDPVTTVGCGPTSCDFLSSVGPICDYSSLSDLGRASDGPHGCAHSLQTFSGSAFHQAPSNPWFFIWHAFVDDVWKEWECNCTNNPSQQISGVDLWMMDINNDQKSIISDGLDVGYEPFPVTIPLGEVPIYLSTDIWVRILDDGKFNEGINSGTTNPGNQTHQNPDYSASGNDNFVYVKVRNRGCQASSGGDKLKLYWSKASTGLNWPTTWENHNPNGNLLKGDVIGELTIPPIKAGGMTILKFSWNPPNPEDFGDSPDQGSHVCLLARIETSPKSGPFDPLYNYGMKFTETSDLTKNVVNNNNIVWKNVTVVNTPINGRIGIIVGNPCNEVTRLNFAFAVPPEDLGNKTIDDGSYTSGHNIITLGPKEDFTENGTVIVDLGREVYTKWVEGGKKGNNVEDNHFIHKTLNGILQRRPLQYLMDQPSPYAISVTGTNATIENLQFDANEYQTIHVEFFYHPQPTGATKRDFQYLVHQKSASPTAKCSGIGGEGFDISRPQCTLPYAGPNVTIGQGCTTTLTASPIVTGATYKWFNNSNGSFVNSGSSIEVSPLVNTSYELQVATPDRCVGYDIVNVAIDNSPFSACLTISPTRCFSNVSVYPNPANSVSVNVRFTTEENAPLSITLATILGVVKLQQFPTSIIGENTLQLDVANLPTGVYKLSIKCTNGTGSYTETITKY
ncbi:MAG: hypothetical protein ACI8ZO_001052 [Flavobacteriales bacterium]|jgi:hypothetical protein